MLKKFLWSMLLLPSVLVAVDLSPWYSRDLELQPIAVNRYQNFERVNTVKGNKCYSSNDYFLSLSISGAYAAYSIELESNWADTRHRNFGFADASITGRYQLLDDVIDDPVSLIAGVTLRPIFKLARNDLANFYHGAFEAEGHIAVGKETSCWQYWYSRVWGVCAVGIADRGSPWIRADVAWEHNWWDRHQFNVFLDTLWGLGSHGLHGVHHFKGYGNIRHQSVDAGFLYSFATDCFGIWSFGYTRRFYALNCPRNANNATLSILYPFGL